MIGTLMGALVGVVIGALAMGVLIWIVGKLGLGLEVDGFGSAFVGGLAVAVLGGVLNWFWTQLLGYDPGTGFMAFIFHLLVAAAVLMVAGKWVSGLRVKGYGGALVAALAIAGVAWLIAFGMTLFS